MTEERQVPEASFGSYYGRPILKAPRWREPHLPAYLFLGELSGGAAMLGAAFLTAELGRPERFLNMLRVAKPTSPMSMGSWTLAAHTGLVTAAAASSVTGLLPGLGAVAGAASALTGPVLAAYPGVLLANTAVPAWHTAYRELPLLFTGGAMTATAAAALAAAAWPGSGAGPGPAVRLAVAGAVTEGMAAFSLEHRLGEVGEPYRGGDAGRLLRAARVMTAAGGVCALAARRSRGAGVLGAALLAGGGLAAKFAVLRAGVASASDPRYVVAQQRGGRAEPASEAVPAPG